MKTLYDAFGTEKQYEQDGVTLDFGVSKFRVRRAGGSNRRFLSALAEMLKPHRRALDAGLMTDEQTGQLLMEVYFKEVIIGWENVTDRSGNILEYSLGNFKQVMTDLPDLWSTLRQEADNIKNFQAAESRHDGDQLGKS